MSYCTITDVQELIPKFTIGASTTPTTTQVNSLITKIAGEIDAALEVKGISTPVTSPANFVIWLQNLNALGVAYRAMQGMFPSTAEKDSTPVWQTYRKDYKEGLQAIQDSNGQSIASIAADPGSLYTYSGTDQDEYPDPVFRIASKDREF